MRTLVEILEHRVAVQPGDQAIIFLHENGEEESVTYQQLEEKVKRIAICLQKDTKVGDRAMLLYTPSIEYVAAFFGCLYAGVIPVPAYPPGRKSLDKLEKIAINAGVSIILTELPILNRVFNLLEQKPSSFFKNLSQNARNSGNNQSIPWVATSSLRNTAGIWKKPDITEDHIAFLQYTSGSTGAPKGVILTHKNLVANAYNSKVAFNMNKNQHMVSWLPPYHDMGLIGGILQPIYMGFPTTLMTPVSFLKRPYRWLKAISDCDRPVISGAPDFAYALCTSRISPSQLQELDLSNWELAYSGAEPVRKSTMQQFYANFKSTGFKYEKFFPVYGLAEVTLLASAGDTEAMPIHRDFDKEALNNDRVQALENTTINGFGHLSLTSCGNGIDNQGLIIVNPSTFEQEEEGRVGEIWVNGDNIAKGYWNRPKLTEEAFNAFTSDQKGPFFRTGDLGFFSNGELYIAGRLKDMIIIRGKNYYPNDLEFTGEKAHINLRSGCTAAFSVEVENQEKLVMLLEVTREAYRKLDSKEIIESIKSAIFEEHALKAHTIALLKPLSVPKTSSGKIRRFACKEMFAKKEFAPLALWSNGRS